MKPAKKWERAARAACRRLRISRIKLADAQPAPTRLRIRDLETNVSRLQSRVVELSDYLDACLGAKRILEDRCRKYVDLERTGRWVSNDWILANYECVKRLTKDVERLTGKGEAHGQL